MSFHLCQANLTVNRLFLLAWVLLHFTRAGTGIALQDDVFCFKVANTICFGKLLPISAFTVADGLYRFIWVTRIHVTTQTVSNGNWIGFQHPYDQTTRFSLVYHRVPCGQAPKARVQDKCSGETRLKAF